MSDAVWANLLGTWHNLQTEDPDCTIGTNGQNPSTWWEENADIWAPNTMKDEHTMYQLPHVLIFFKGHTYRVSPTMIQIVDET
ncbi:hypothetical protein [Lactiplantibacillus pentosus]|uniref:hypothetical protein n=1 Tax=Lactiplantibacillus pentosus TaxID=1589 RepID=UPI00067DE74D|nr:hypothetical protein [Lactiplantibacillus pentosus]